MAWTVEDFQQRLIDFITNQLGLSVRKFEESCGLTNGQIASTKVKGPSVEVLSKISETYPELDLNWLIAGRGSMLAPDRSAATPSVSIGSVQTINIGNWEELLAPIRAQMDSLYNAITEKK